MPDDLASASCANEGLKVWLAVNVDLHRICLAAKLLNALKLPFEEHDLASVSASLLF